MKHHRAVPAGGVVRAQIRTVHQEAAAAVHRTAHLPATVLKAIPETVHKATQAEAEAVPVQAAAEAVPGENVEEMIGTWLNIKDRVKPLYPFLLFVSATATHFISLCSHGISFAAIESPV